MHCKGIPHALQRDFPLLPLSASRNVYPSLASWAHRNSSGWSILGRAGPSMEMVQLLGCSTGCVLWETWLNCQYKNTKAFWEVSLSKKALSYLVPVDGVLCVLLSLSSFYSHNSLSGFWGEIILKKKQDFSKGFRVTAEKCSFKII